MSNFDLYEGVSGIGLLFLYAGITFKEDRFIEFSEIIKNYIIDSYIDRNYQPIGAFSGISGMVYFLSHYYFHFKDRSILEKIALSLNKINDLISKDSSFDIIDGVSGCLLVLNSLQKIDGVKKEKINRIKLNCLKHLLDNYIDPTQHPNEKYRSADGKNSNLGFAHGVAGIIYALIKTDVLSSQNLNNRRMLWIDRGLSYLKNALSQDFLDWPDFRKGDSEYLTAWCHGSPGIGITYLEGLRDRTMTKIAINNIFDPSPE